MYCLSFHYFLSFLYKQLFLYVYNKHQPIYYKNLIYQSLFRQLLITVEYLLVIMQMIVVHNAAPFLIHLIILFFLSLFLVFHKDNNLVPFESNFYQIHFAFAQFWFFLRKIYPMNILVSVFVYICVLIFLYTCNLLQRKVGRTYIYSTTFYTSKTRLVSLFLCIHCLGIQT